MAAIAPLTGIKVIDLTKLAPGPHCTMILGDLGADIIKVEEPGAPTGRRAEQARTGRRLASVGPARYRPTPSRATSDRSASISKALLARKLSSSWPTRLTSSSRNTVPASPSASASIMKRCAKRNPKLIYCAVTGFGQTGPYRELVGHDLNYIATAGALSLIGRKDQPPTIPLNLLADYAGGGMHAAIGVLAALVSRATTGRGQFVDAAMLDGTMLLIASALSTHFQTGKVPRRGNNQVDGASPFYNMYETKDGKTITIGSVEPWFYANLCRALGCEEFIEDQQNKERWNAMQRALHRSLQDPHPRRMVRSSDQVRHLRGPDAHPRRIGR